MRRHVVSLLALCIASATPALAAAPVPTSLSIAVNPTSITQIGSAVVTATVTPNTGTIDCGKGQIQYNILHIDTTSTGWLQLANNLSVVANQFSAIFDGTLIFVTPGDRVSFRAGYESTAGGCNFQNDAIGQSPTADLLIDASAAAACPNGQITGVHIIIEGPNGVGAPPPGYAGTWSFDVKVQACEDVFDVTAQGGANGWAPVKFFTPASAAVQQFVKNKNTVYLWTIGNLTQGQTATLTVNVGATIKNSPNECGKVKLLNGDWSAMYATVAGGARTKSDYTNYTSTITVSCP